MSTGTTVSLTDAAQIGETLRLKIVVIYEDPAAGLHARQVLDEMARRLAFDVSLDLTIWRMGLLLDVALRQQVTHDTESAHILFLACHGNRKLPAAVKDWFLSWLATRDGAPSALAVSLDGTARDIPDTRATLDLLLGAAGLVGVEAFVHFCKATGAEAGLRTEGPQLGSGGTSRWSEEQYYEHWGLND